MFGDPLKGISSGYPPTASREKLKILKFTLHLKANKTVRVNSAEFTNVETVQLHLFCYQKGVGASALDGFCLLGQVRFDRRPHLNNSYPNSSLPIRVE